MLQYFSRVPPQPKPLTDFPNPDLSTKLIHIYKDSSCTFRSVLASTRNPENLIINHDGCRLDGSVPLLFLFFPSSLSTFAFVSKHEESWLSVVVACFVIFNLKAKAGNCFFFPKTLTFLVFNHTTEYHKILKLATFDCCDDLFLSFSNRIIFQTHHWLEH